MIYFLIPVYNEQQNLPALIDSIEQSSLKLKRGFKIIFVDDGSTDDSLNLLKTCQNNNSDIIVLSHFPNQGVRKTFLAGFKKFLELAGNGDVLITQEADNTSDHVILEQMLHAIVKDKFDVVLASCYMNGGSIINSTFFRKLLSKGANLLVKTRFNLWGIHTFSSFYRAFTYKSLQDLFSIYNEDIMTINGFCCVVEMLIKLVKRNNKIKEIPFTLNAAKRKGASKIPLLRTIKGYLWLCFRRY